MQGTLVLNASEEPLAYIRWQQAVCRVLADQAWVKEEHATERVRSQRVDMARPAVIVLNQYVYIPFTDTERSAGKSVAFHKILKRDKFTCAYCGSKEGRTVDHILPKSRGGRDTWENLVACCAPCNGFKADRTPKEAGMRLRFEPYVVEQFKQAQRKVWKNKTRPHAVPVPA